MTMAEQNLETAPGVARDFRTTHWSVVLAAGQASTEQSAAALEKLCRTYWFPLYAFVRRQGHAPPEAQDLTQEFFSRLLAKNPLGTLQPAKGRFRSYLIASMKHLLANEWDRAHRQKRGGRVVTFSLDEKDAEERYVVEPADELTPEKIFERRWAEALLEQVLARLRVEFRAAGQEDRYELLKPFLVGDDDPGPGEELAARLGLGVSGAKSAIRRLRQRYGELFREEIAQTVESEEEIDAEIRHLFAALSG